MESVGWIKESSDLKQMRGGEARQGGRILIGKDGVAYGSNRKRM